MINPGTGPVVGSTLDNAHANMQKLLEDAGFPDASWRRNVDAPEDDGRFSFLVECPADDEHPRGYACSVDMPGISLEAVRYVGAKDQNIWHFPRLYVDGSSWVWKFAVNALRWRLTREP